MTFSLTPAQKRLLLYIEDSIRERGVAPSLREMKAHLDCTSVSHVHGLLTALEHRGAIRRLHGRARAIELLVAADPSPQAAARDALARIRAPATEANVAHVARALSECQRVRTT